MKTNNSYASQMTATSRMYELIIFDCDGVLIDSEPIANRVFAEQLGTVGLRMSVDEVVNTFVGRTRTGCLNLTTELLGCDLPTGFSESWDAALFKALTREVTTAVFIASGEKNDCSYL